MSTFMPTSMKKSQGPVRWCRELLSSLAVVSLGCHGGAAETSDSSGGTSVADGTAAQTESSGTTTTDAPTTGGPLTGTSAEPTGNASCEDGAVDEGEACDDGNAIDGDGCNSDCSLSGALVWEYRSTRSESDNFRGVAVAEDASIFVGGDQAVEGQERLLLRFTPDGDMVWTRTYEQADSSAILAVGVDGSRLYGAGMTGSDKRSLWIGAFDLEGESVWEDVVSSDFGHAYATGLALTPDGDIVVVGLSTLEGGDAEIWTRRYGADGSIAWTRGRPIGAKALYSEGPAIAAGAERVTVGFYSKPDMGELIVAYPSAGGEPLLDLSIMMHQGPIYGIAVDPMGDILATGWQAQTGASVRRYTADGATLWSNFDCTGSAGRAIALDGRGDVVVLGDGPGNDSSNIRLCKFSSEGKMQWGKDIDGGEGNDYGRAVAIMPDNRVVAAGEMQLGGARHGWLGVFAP